MDKPTKDCVKYLKKLIKVAEKGDIIITMMNTDLYHDTECQDEMIKGYKDTGRRRTNIEWRDLRV